MGASPEILSLLISVAIGYLLGAIPLADRVSRRKGIDIFSIGTGLAGATNVRRNVGPKSAAVVVLGDAAKGMIAILAAKQMGIEGPWLFVPAIATVVGHWNSIFTRFKGGDGLVVLGGICLVVFSPFPVGNLIAVLAVLVGIAVALGGQKLPYTSLLCIFSGYGSCHRAHLPMESRRNEHRAGDRHSGANSVRARGPGTRAAQQVRRVGRLRSRRAGYREPGRIGLERLKRAVPLHLSSQAAARQRRSFSAAGERPSALLLYRPSR